jgi:uncharacterized YigZ family protein
MEKFMPKEYRTVSKPVQVEFTEKKSRFITSVAPINSENEALQFLEKVRSQYWDARHNVYAYKIVAESVVQRYSDDGEPAGTAGMPIMEAINRLNIINVILIVTRYFGGILLGASGLVRAYGKSAVSGIESAGIITKRLCDISKISLDYSMLGKVRNCLNERGYNIGNIQYDEEVKLFVPVPVDENDAFARLIDDLTGAKAVISLESREYISVQ